MVETVPAPDHLGRFRLCEKLGAGAMGTVYRAEADDGPVALKVIHSHLLERSGYFKRFQREAEAGRRVEHPNVVRTLDCDLLMVEGEPFFFLVMEYVEGKTLRELLLEARSMPEALAREIGRQIAAGLAAIHEAGIVHRDVKPENVLITDDHRVRIMDLGVARIEDAATQLTAEGHFAGSLGYAAPEQFRQQTIGPAADLYALGVLLYELVSGTNPFRHDGAAAVMRAHLEEVPPALDGRDPNVSLFFAALVATLLAKRPGERFESADVLSRTLERGEKSGWWQSRERSLLEERTRRVRVPVRRETALYGREADLALLQDAWARAKAGDGNTVLLDGEAGIGKSRLVDAFLEGLDGEQAHVLYGSYAPSGGMGAISDALLGHFGQAELEAALRPHLTVTPSLVPALAAVLKREVPPEGAPSLQGDALHTVYVHLMRSMAEERPLAWVVEDLHFGDVDNRELILSLARAVEGRPILLCLTTRAGLPEEELAHLRRLENLRRTALRRLGAREVVELLRDAFRSERLADKLGARIAYKSDGVPFFVFEMIRGLKEGQFITQLPDGSWIESKVIDEIEIPSSVRDLIGIRLSELTKDDRAILEVGAVQGYEFDPDLVARVLKRPRVALFQDAAEIERRSGVLRSEGRALRFDHHQIHEVVYESLMPVLRDEYHSLLARALTERDGVGEEPSSSLPGDTVAFLARHFLMGSEPREGLPYLEPALDHWERNCALDKALALCETALAAPGLLRGETRLRLLGRKLQKLKLLGRPVESRAVLDEARALAESSGSEPWQARVDAWTGSLHLATGRAAEALECYERALTVTRRVGDTDQEAALTINVGACLNRVGREDKARACFHRGLRLARECGSPEWAAKAESSLGSMANAAGRFEEARECWKCAQTVFRDHGLREGEALTWLSLGKASLSQGQPEQAREELERGLATYERYGLRANKADVLGTLGRLFSSLRQYEEAETFFQRALALCEETGEVRFAASVRSGLASMSLARGFSKQALENREAALALCEYVGTRYGMATILSGIGSLHVDLGQPNEGRRRIRAALEMFREMPDRPGAGLTYGHLGNAELELGEPAEAERLYREGLRLCRAKGERTDVARVLQFLGDLLGRLGRVEEAREALEEALTYSRESGRPDVEVQVLCLLALLPGGDALQPMKTYRAHRERLDTWARMRACFLLWQASAVGDCLVEARQLLNHLVEHAPEEYRDSMLKNVRLHREIMEAWAKHAGEEPVRGAPETA